MRTGPSVISICKFPSPPLGQRLCFCPSRMGLHRIVMASRKIQPNTDLAAPSRLDLGQELIARKRYPINVVSVGQAGDPRIRAGNIVSPLPV